MLSMDSMMVLVEGEENILNRQGMDCSLSTIER